MKSFLFFIFFIITTLAIAMEKSDSIKYPVNLSGTVSLNSNGIAPIPSFSLGKSMVSATISITKNRFSYDPQLSYGFDMKPWIIDNWFHYKLMDRSKFELRTGINASMFFSEYKTTDEAIYQGQRYATFELAGMYKFSKTSSLSLITWYDKGLEDGTISGYFLNLVADKSDIRVGNHFLMAVNLQTFYIDFTDKNDGLFISPKISCSSMDVPGFIFFQAIQPLISNILPSPEFQWNVGIGFSF